MSIKRPISLKKIIPAIPTEPKKFTVEPWTTSGGKRIMVYGDTGLGKTTLCITSPNPVFLGLDEGGEELRHPQTGEKINRVPEVKNFADVRAALQQVNLFDSYNTVVIDTVTLLEEWAIQYVLDTITGPKDNPRPKEILGYGYNKGFRYLYDVMKTVLADCDELIRRGKNVILVAQAIASRVSNPGGEDYLRDGPRLYAGKPSIEALYCEWANHIFRIDYYNAFVKSKKVSGSTERAIFCQPELYFRAKSRTLKESPISFESEADDSLWKLLFNKVE